jgi:hypothetical protein
MRSNEMTAAFEHSRIWNLMPASKAVALKGAIAGAWPPVGIGFGLALTLVWTGSLLWLCVRTVMALL